VNCETQIHQKCVCPKDKKIPRQELNYIRDQRQKHGSKGTLQIGSADWKETTKHNKKILRKQKSAKDEVPPKALPVDYVPQPNSSPGKVSRSTEAHSNPVPTYNNADISAPVMLGMR